MINEGCHAPLCFQSRPEVENLNPETREQRQDMMDEGTGKWMTDYAVEDEKHERNETAGRCQQLWKRKALTIEGCGRSVMKSSNYKTDWDREEHSAEREKEWVMKNEKSSDDTWEVEDERKGMRKQE